MCIRKQKVFLLISCLLLLSVMIDAQNRLRQEDVSIIVKDTLPMNRKSPTAVEDVLPTINNEKTQFIDNDGKVAKKLFVNDKEIKAKNINIDISKIKRIETRMVKNGDLHLYIYTEYQE